MDALVESFLTVKTALESLDEEGGNLLGFMRSGFEVNDEDDGSAPQLGNLESELASDLQALGTYRYFISGEISLEDDIQLKLSKVKIPDGNAIIDHLSLSCNTFSAEDFLPYCIQAPFGNLAEESTDVDPNVRNCLECTAESFHLESSDGLNTLEEVKKAISKKLAHGKEVELVPHRLNIYQAGGHFKPHVDTPRDSEK
jgi:hypothetical protein